MHNDAINHPLDNMIPGVLRREIVKRKTAPKGRKNIFMLQNDRMSMTNIYSMLQ